MRPALHGQPAPARTEHIIEGGGIAVRATVAADWPVLKAVRLAALADAPTAFGVSHASACADPDSRWIKRAEGSGPGRFFLAWQGSEAVGMVAAVVSDAEMAKSDSPGGAASPGTVANPGTVASPGTALGLIAMWVAPAWRGKRGREAGGGASVADRLIEAIKALARARGASTVQLEVAPANAAAVALYARHGFCFEDHLEVLASHPDIEVQRMTWPVPTSSARPS